MGTSKEHREMWTDALRPDNIYDFYPNTYQPYDYTGKRIVPTPYVPPDEGFPWGGVVVATWIILFVVAEILMVTHGT